MSGSNDSGQLGLGSKSMKELQPKQVTLVPEQVYMVACGVAHSLFLTTGGSVFASGSNNSGELGIGNRKSTKVPVKVKDLEHERIRKVDCKSASLALSGNCVSSYIIVRGSVYIWGLGVFGEIFSPQLI